jgi:methyl-accepting chemotaxis protein
MKIASWSGVCLLITAAIIVLYSGAAMKKRAEIAREQAIIQARKLAGAVSKEHANYIRAELELALDAARAIAHALSGIKDKEVRLELGREEVNGILRIILAQNPEFVGIFTCWEPNAFDRMDIGYINKTGHDKTGRFIPYWSRSKEGNIMVRPLEDYDKPGAGDYYLLPKRTGEECVIDPYVYPVQGTPALITSLVVPVIAEGTFYGIVGIDMRLDVLQELVDKVENFYDGTARILLISHNGTMAAVTGRPDMAGKPLAIFEKEYGQSENFQDILNTGREAVPIPPGPPLEKGGVSPAPLFQKGGVSPAPLFQKGGTPSFSKGGIGTEGDHLKVITPMKIGHTTTPWFVNVLVPMKKITAAADEHSRQAVRDIKRMIAISVACVVIVFLVLCFIVHIVMTAPVKKIAAFIRAFGKGDLTVRLDIESKDEVGDMAGDLNKSVINLRDIMTKLSDTVRSLSDSSGKLSSLSSQMASSAEETNAQTGTVAAAAEQISASVGAASSAAEEASLSTGDIAGMTEEMSSTFDDVAVFARKTAENVRNVADSGDEIASDIELIATSVEEMTVSLNEVAKNTAQASHISQNAASRTLEMNAKMEALENASKQIGKIVGVIKDIADQTNMLALNATIEAAGAGEAGKGFAVVAGEVKELARQSADATDEISNQIEQIQNSTTDVVAAIREINGIINEIAGINQVIASSAEEQTSAAGEISKSVSKNARSVKSVAENTSESARLVSEISRSVDETSRTANEVAKHVEKLSNGAKDVALSSAEVSRGVQDISRDIQNISAASKETAIGAAQTRHASEDMDRIAQSLSEIVKRFKVY